MNIKDLKEGDGFRSFSKEYTLALCKKLEELGYPIYEGTYKNGKFKSICINLYWYAKDGEFISCDAEQLKKELDIFELESAKPPKPQLKHGQGFRIFNKEHAIALCKKIKELGYPVFLTSTFLLMDDDYFKDKYLTWNSYFDIFTIAKNNKYFEELDIFELEPF